MKSETIVSRVKKADALMDDDLMRGDPKSMTLEAAGGAFVIVKALEKVVKMRVDEIKAVLRERIKPGDKLDTDNFWVKHVIQQRKPTLSFDKVRELVEKHNLPEDKVFLIPPVPPIEEREVDLDFLGANVPGEELNQCYVDSGQTLQIRQGAKGDLKKRLAEVVR